MIKQFRILKAPNPAPIDACPAQTLSPSIGPGGTIGVRDRTAEKSGKRIERCVVSTLQTAGSIDFRQREQIAGVIVGLEVLQDHHPTK